MMITISCTTNYVSAKELSNYNQNGYAVNGGDKCQMVRNNDDMAYISYQENVDQKVVEEILNNVKLKIINSSQDIGIHSVITPPDDGMNVGAAWPYIRMGYNTSVNCYGYALGLNASINPGSFAWRNDGIERWSSIETVVKAVNEDLIELKRTIRPLNSVTDKIDSFEYRIALRIGQNLKFRDYHFLVQCSSGGWCSKLGDDRTEDPKYMNPSDDSSWPPYGSDEDFYSGPTVYFAISR